MEFIDSWALFGETYAAGWLIAVLLSSVGVWMVARDQIFLGAAVSQASTLGTAVALWLQGVFATHALGADLLTFGLAVAASIATALITGRTPQPGRESSEAITGWVFLVGASLPVLMLAHSPHGLEEVHRILFSSILGASRTDVFLFLALSVGTGLGLLRFAPRLVLFAMDPDTAAVTGGMNTRRWTIGTAVWLGTAVGLSIHSAGLLYTFGCLVLPALTARNLCREVLPMFAVAPVVALSAALVAFPVAHALDVPPAQFTVALLCAVVGVSWVVRRVRVAGELA